MGTLIPTPHPERIRTPGETTPAAPPGRPAPVRGANGPGRDRTSRRRVGFTLVELLVVILIIALVSAVALPTVLPALNHRQVSEAARILQGALVGARDKAIHDNQPSGVRLLLDPAYPIVNTTGTNPQLIPYPILAYNRLIPIESPPQYTEGYCTTIPAAAITAMINGQPYNVTPSVTFNWLSRPPEQLLPVPNVSGGPNLANGNIPPCLLLCESVVHTTGLAPNPPTSWFWNIRVGDRIQLNNSGPWYTIIGPMAVPPTGATIGGTFYANPEGFVNIGPPATTAHYQGVLPNLNYQYSNGGNVTSSGPQPSEFLLLVNGNDDNNNGWLDEGWDGVDNNGNQVVDELPEWEQEEWLGSVDSKPEVNIPYTIQRRPAPAANAREIALPTAMVIDATTQSLAGAAPIQHERSRLPVNPFTGNVDIILNPDGTVAPNVIYSSPASFSMDSFFYHFWLAERQDLAPVLPNGMSTPQNLVPGAPYFLPIADPGGKNPNGYPGPYLKGEYSVLTLFGRTGQIAVNSTPPFLDPNGNYHSAYPFIPAERGTSGAP